jgi:serine protease inhibitor
MKVSSGMELKNILSETFHMKDLFESGKADFTPMTSASGLAVSSVVHKAVLEVRS